MPENQTAWNSDNQGIKEKVNQNNQTGKNPWRGGRLHGQGWQNGKQTQSWLWSTAGVVTVGETPISHESSSESGLEPSRAALLPLWPLPPWQCCGAAKRVALTWWIPKAPTPYNLIGVPRQRNVAQMKEQSKTSERELNDEEIANLSDGEFRALVIKMLTDWLSLIKKWKIPQMK